MNEMLPFATAWIVLEVITLSEKSQPKKDKDHFLYHLYAQLKEQNKPAKTKTE